jgi:hypothetical protein
MKLTIFHIASHFSTIKPSYNGLSATFKDRPHFGYSSIGLKQRFRGEMTHRISFSVFQRDFSVKI